MTVRHFPEPQRSGARLMLPHHRVHGVKLEDSNESKKIRVAVPFTAKRFSSLRRSHSELCTREQRTLAMGDVAGDRSE